MCTVLMSVVAVQVKGTRCPEAAAGIPASCRRSSWSKHCTWDRPHHGKSRWNTHQYYTDCASADLNALYSVNINIMYFLDLPFYTLLQFMYFPPLLQSHIFFYFVLHF